MSADGAKTLVVGCLAVAAVGILAGCATPKPVPVPAGLIPPASITRVVYGSPVPGDYVAGGGNHLWVVFPAGSSVDVDRAHCDGMGGLLELDRDVGFYCLDPVDF